MLLHYLVKIETLQMHVSSNLAYADEVVDDSGVLADDRDDDRRGVLVVRVALLDVGATVHHSLNCTHVVRRTSLAQCRPTRGTDLVYVRSYTHRQAINQSVSRFLKWPKWCNHCKNY